MNYSWLSVCPIVFRGIREAEGMPRSHQMVLEGRRSHVQVGQGASLLLIFPPPHFLVALIMDWNGQGG